MPAAVHRRRQGRHASRRSRTRPPPSWRRSRSTPRPPGTIVGERYEAQRGRPRSAASFLYAAGGTTPLGHACGSSCAGSTPPAPAIAAAVGRRRPATPRTGLGALHQRHARPGPGRHGLRPGRAAARSPAAAGDAYVTGIDARKGDPAALARITATEAVATSASGAIAHALGADHRLLRHPVGVRLARPGGRRPGRCAGLDLGVPPEGRRGGRHRRGGGLHHARTARRSRPSGSTTTIIDLDGRVSARDLVDRRLDQPRPRRAAADRARSGTRATSAEWTV